MTKKHNNSQEQAHRLVYDQVITPMATEMAKSQPPSKLESPTQTQERVREQLWGTYLKFQERLGNAMRILKDSGCQMHVLDQKRATLLEAPGTLNDLLSAGVTMQEMLGIPNNEMMQFYDVAGEHYAKRDYRSASDLFLLLTQLNFGVAPFWLGLGMAEQGCEEYDIAATAYAVAAELDATDLTPYIYAARCIRYMKGPREAVKILDVLIQKAAEDDRHLKTKSEALSLKAQWQKAA